MKWKGRQQSENVETAEKQSDPVLGSVEVLKDSHGAAISATAFDFSIGCSPGFFATIQAPDAEDKIQKKCDEGRELFNKLATGMGLAVTEKAPDLNQAPGFQAERPSQILMDSIKF